MKLCIPVIENKGLDSVVSDHFGRAPFHIIVDLETDHIDSLRKANECGDEDHGHCMPVDLLLSNGVKVVACKGIGRGAVNRLRSNDIALFSTTAHTVREVVDDYRAQKLGAIDEAQICQGHHH